MNIFERASRAKLRFSTSAGVLSIDDLWDMTLPGLNIVAKAVNASLKADQEEDFISDAAPEDTMSMLRMDLLKHVISEKKTQEGRTIAAADTRKRKAVLLELIAEKDNESDKKLSKTQLLKMVEAL